MSVSACGDRGRRPRCRGRQTQECEMAGGETFVEHDHDDLRSTRRSAGATPPHGPGRSGSDVSPLPDQGTSTTSLAACTSSGSTRRTHSVIRRSRSGQTGEGALVQRFGQLVLPPREGREPGTRPAAVTEYPSAGRAAGRGNATDLPVGSAQYRGRSDGRPPGPSRTTWCGRLPCRGGHLPVPEGRGRTAARRVRGTRSAGHAGRPPHPGSFAGRRVGAWWSRSYGRVRRIARRCARCSRCGAAARPLLGRPPACPSRKC